MAVGAGGTPFLGREAELDGLLRLLAEVREGGGGTVLVEGEPGIGKTRLLEEALAIGASDGIRLVRATAREVERHRPFGVIAEALDLVTSSPDPDRAGIASPVVSDAPDGEGPVEVNAGPDVRYHVVEAVVGLTERLASRGPVVFALEDLHWADPSSLLTVHALARRLHGLPLGVIATFRPGGSGERELDRVVEELVAEDAARLVLAPLGVDQVAELVAAVVGARPNPGLREHLERARGNPLFVLELLRALDDEKLLIAAGEETALTAFSLPASLRLVLLRRFSHVSRPTLEVLQVASVLGSRFDVLRLSLVTGRSAADLAPLLQEAIRSAVVCEAGTGLAFRHDLIREAMYGALPAALRAGLHRDAAWALADAGATPVHVAEHLALGARPGDRRAREWLHGAARDILPLAPASSAELLERALMLTADTDPARDALLGDLVVASMWSGRLREAEELASGILRRPHDREVGMAVRAVLIDVLWIQGRIPEMVHESRVAMGDRLLSGGALALLGALAATGLLYSGDVGAAAEPADEARREADEVGDDTASCAARSVLGLTALMQAHAGTAVAVLEEAVLRAERSPSKAALRSTYCPYIMLGLALLAADRLKDAVRAFREGLRLSEELGAAGNLPLFHWGLAACHFSSGHWDEAVVEAETGFLLGHEVGAAMGAAMAEATVAMIAFHRNELARADAQLTRAEAAFPDSGPEVVGTWLPWARALLLEAHGEVDAPWR